MEQVLERYNRQILVPEVGLEGQEELGKKRVLVVGAGGLGTPCLLYLTGMGIGHIAVVDSDKVSLSNLPRQVAYNIHDLGKSKAKVMAKKLQLANPNSEVEPLPVILSDANALDFVKTYDVVVSCVDNMETRYVLNRACVEAGVPMVEGAVSGFQGLLTVIVPGQSPCYECIFPAKVQTEKKPIGVVGPVPGVIGSIQAAEVLKLLLRKGDLLSGILLIVDLLRGDFRFVEVKRNPECPVCGARLSSTG